MDPNSLCFAYCCTFVLVVPFYSVVIRSKNQCALMDKVDRWVAFVKGVVVMMILQLMQRFTHRTPAPLANLPLGLYVLTVFVAVIIWGLFFWLVAEYYAPQTEAEAEDRKEFWLDECARRQTIAVERIRRYGFGLRTFLLTPADVYHAERRKYLEAKRQAKLAKKQNRSYR